MVKRELAQIPSPRKRLTLSGSPCYSVPRFSAALNTSTKPQPSLLPLEQRTERETEGCAASSVVPPASAAAAAAVSAADADDNARKDALNLVASSCLLGLHPKTTGTPHPPHFALQHPSKHRCWRISRPSTDKKRGGEGGGEKGGELPVVAHEEKTLMRRVAMREDRRGMRKKQRWTERE